jgi:hypothetical protein
MTFALIALATVLVYINYSITTLDQYNQSIMGKNFQLLNQAQEKFQVTSANLVNNKLNITVVNTGILPINFTKIWVQNMTATNRGIDSVYSYNPTTANFVSPGGTLKNLGLSMPVSINPLKAYSIKLITSRGNAQQFGLNSASSAPINIQLYFLPASVTTGFKSELVMIVSNNSTSTLINISTSALPTPTGLATCNAGPASPSSYNTLPPGGTAIFKWDVTISGVNGQTCTYTLNTPLQNGYSQTVQATLTVNVITFSQTNLAESTGILTLNYSTFRWTQDGATWNTGWAFPNGATAFLVKVTNNNATGDFYISQYSQMAFQPRGGGENNKAFFIINNTSSSGGISGITYTCPNPSPNDYCIKIPSGQAVTLYFGAASNQGSTINSLTGKCQWSNSMLLFGQYTSSKGGSGTLYAQTLPYIAVQTTTGITC